jgi:hypothetical protein
MERSRPRPSAAHLRYCQQRYGHGTMYHPR